MVVNLEKRGIRNDGQEKIEILSWESRVDKTKNGIYSCEKKHNAGWQHDDQKRNVRFNPGV